MIFLSPKFIEEQTNIYNDYLNRYFDFEDLTKRNATMVSELLSYNLLTTKEAIKIIKICNADPLRNFSLSEIRRYLISNE
jgi:hypothetical protein